MNWKLARDWEVQEGAAKGYTEAIDELHRRNLPPSAPRPQGTYWTKEQAKR